MTPEDTPAAATPAVPPSRNTLEPAIEQLARDLLRERRRDRRWRTFFRLAWLLLTALLVYTVVTRHSAVAVPAGPHTALVEVKGEIGQEAEANAEALVASLKTAFEDDGAQALVLRINSPGGSPVQAGIVNDEIKRLKAKHRKRVYAVVEEVCASGAYYIAAAADEIYVDKASIVGSIGVLMDSFGFTGTLDKLGIERRLLTAGERKAALDPFSPLSEKDREHVQSMLDQIHRQFIAVVKEGRGPRLKQTPELFSGLFWTGEEAIRLGLADRLGNLDYVAREVVKAEDVVDYSPKESVAEKLAKRLGASFGESAVRALRGFASLR